jgi:ATP-dependent Clp protease, protease subunit
VKNNGNADMGLTGLMSMMDESKCVWVTEFNSEAVIRFYEKFMKLEMDDEVRIIPVFINSYGGDVYALIAMRDMIKSSPKPVATIAVGMAMSCGASLLAAGSKDYRFASPDAQILIHQVFGIAPGKVADLIESAKVTADLNKTMFRNLAKDSGRTVEEFEKEIHKRKNVDWTLKASAAKRWGLIDHIGIPRPHVQPSMMFLGNAVPYEDAKAMEDDMKRSSKRRKKRT